MSHPDFSQLYSREFAGPTLKCVRVNLDKIVLAIPLDCIDRVIRQTPVLGSGLSHMGVIHYADTPITVIDLHYQLFQTRKSGINQESYLIITKTMTQNTLAFPIQETPNLIEFPVSKLRVLPPLYRHSDTLGIASHVIRISQPSGEENMFFILDVDYLASHYEKKTFQIFAS